MKGLQARAVFDDSTAMTVAVLPRGGSPVKRWLITALMVVLPVVLTPGSARGQAFFPRDTPKFPQARTWVAQKAKLPPAKELWEVGCHEGNGIGTEAIHSLGFKWYKGVTPPK